MHLFSEGNVLALKAKWVGRIQLFCLADTSAKKNQHESNKIVSLCTQEVMFWYFGPMSCVVTEIR